MKQYPLAYHMALANHESWVYGSLSKIVKVFDKDTGALLETLPVRHVGNIVSSPDGRLVAFAIEFPSSVKVFQAVEGHPLCFQFKTKGTGVPYISFSADSRFLYIGCGNKIHLVSLVDDQVQIVFQAEPDGICCGLTCTGDQALASFFNRELNERPYIARINGADHFTATRIALKEPLTPSLRRRGNGGLKWAYLLPSQDVVVGFSSLPYVVARASLEEDNRLSEAHEELRFDDFILRAFYSPQRNCVGVLSNDYHSFAFFSLDSKRPIFQTEREDFIAYPSISNSGRYLLIPCEKKSLLVDLQEELDCSQP